MDPNALLPSRDRVREWQASLTRHARIARRATSESIIPLYIRSFAWIGSVEPCTGVLCETCQRCLRDFLILKVRTGTHHTTASSMLAAVRIGCRICTCLWRQFAGDRSIDPENVPRKMDEGLPAFSRFSSNSRGRYCSRWPRFPKFKVWDTRWLKCPEWYIEPSATRNETVPRIELSSYQSDRIGLMDHYWKLAKGWLSECLSHHTRCKHVTSVEDYCPTRLIDVRANSSDCELRLYSTSNGPIKEPYMTLSHCWGKAQFLRLTSSTHDRLQRGFALAELPPTFQDAIMVTRALGVNFLWIDALCILQDSIVDWQHEATMMSQVYSNAICNISALDAHDSTGGLFFNRETSTIPYCNFTACRKFKRKRVYDCAYTDFWSDSVQHAPLSRRAWVLQERLLAPRVLHFSKRQLLWECNQLRACEFYPKGMPAAHRALRDVSNTDEFLKESVTTILQGLSDSSLTSSQMHRAWNYLVLNYTKCNLTMSKDKLAAISGIVKRMQPLFKTDYLAGLWRDNLVEQLLWRVESYEQAGKRPKYRAPSWSWASIDAPIVPRPDLYPNVDHMATIIEANVTPVTEDITGQIVDGYICLRGSLFPVKVDTSKDWDSSDLPWDWGCLKSHNQTLPDVWPQSVVKELQFVPLLMTSSPPHIKSLSLEIYGLILDPVEGKQGVYQRWGRAKFHSQKERDILNFGVQRVNRKLTYTPPERYPEQTITLI